MRKGDDAPGHVTKTMPRRCEHDRVEGQPSQSRPSSSGPGGSRCTAGNMVNSARQVNVAAGARHTSIHVKRVLDGLARLGGLASISDCGMNNLQLLLEFSHWEGMSMNAQRKAASVGAGRS